MPKLRIRERMAAKISLIAIGCLFCSQLLGCQNADQTKGNSNNVVECRVLLAPSTEGPTSTEICFKDEQLINDVILQPLRDSKPDPRPAAYAILGKLTILRSDGSSKDFLLFYPWGHYESGDTFLIADFSRLQTECRKTIDYAVNTLSFSESPKTESTKAEH